MTANETSEGYQLRQDASRPDWQDRGVRVAAALAIAVGLAAAVVGIRPVDAGFQETASPTADAGAACTVRTGDGTTGPRVVESPVAEAEPAATPSGSTAPGVPADPETAAAIEQQVRMIAACLTAGDWATVATLVTESYLGATYTGGGALSSAQFLELAEALPAIPVRIVSVGDVRILPGGANVDVVYVFGNELIHARWDFSFVSPTSVATPEGGSLYLLNAERRLPTTPPADAATIAVEIGEYDLSLDRKETSRTSVVLRGNNRAAEEHEMLVVRLGPGTQTDDLLTTPGPGLPEGIEFVGQVTVPAGETANLTLVDLAPGAYGIVCLLPDADGTPHLALGERERFVIE